MRQRRHQQLDQHRQQNDVQAITAREAMKKVQHVEKRHRDETEVAEVDGALEVLAHRLQNVEFFGSDKQRDSDRSTAGPLNAATSAAPFCRTETLCSAPFSGINARKNRCGRSRPRHIAAELMSFARVRRRFALDLVID